jgi:Glutaredoxin and related proteins
MIKLFYLKSCPYCKQAFSFLEQLKPEFPDIELTLIEENEQADLANSYDYYYVPTFYLDEKKVHEGVVTKEIIRDILTQATNS